MKIAHLGIVSTGTVIVLGLAMVVPAFTQHAPDRSIPSVMLSFVITDDANASWCTGLASILENRGVKGTVFVSGKTAQANPECVTSFSSDIDIGSQTYSYVDLTSISDYTKAFEEVKRGKDTIDRVGNIDSRLFRAPHGLTDENIYSLASRSGILADFSYNNRYNKYEDNQFVRYDLKVLPGGYEGFRLFAFVSADDDVVRPLLPVPIAIVFDSGMQLEDVDKFISKLKSEYGNSIRFVNASDLVGIDLTIRGGEQSS
ncbi:MAG TPA: polysaccharide deacetylase family protein [Nitrososphaera sp.]|nr:polysaccharide deacetylase family protein [Nitrososphaera sp.]